MAVRIEFYGIVRHQAGAASTQVEAATLGEALDEVAREFPGLAEHCLDGNRLRAGYLANVNGARFTSDPRTELRQGDTVLLLSADAGG